MAEITSSVVLPVTDAQMMAFSAWVINTYVTYDNFMGAIKSPEVDTYIKNNILPQEMQSVLRRSEPFIGEKRGDIYVHRLQLDRRRIIAKMNNLKGKIVTMLFPVASAQTRRDNRAAALSRRHHREATQIRLDQETLAYRDYMNETYESRVREVHDRRDAMSAKVYPYPPVIKIQLSEEDAKTCVMDDDCVICLAQHKMTDACTINCGHQFGRLCLAKWKKDTCPLCRAQITKTTVFIDTYLKNAAIEQEILATWEVVVA
jgi:hypothetical protein